MRSRPHKANGFTIVELLIVIVVIAILASISVAAFSGIRDRATTSAVVSDVRKMKGLLEQYMAINGSAALDTVIGGSGYMCLGDGFTDQDPGAGTACERYEFFGPPADYVNPRPALDAALRQLGDYTVAKINPIGFNVDGEVLMLTGPELQRHPSGHTVAGNPTFLSIYYIIPGADTDCVLRPQMLYTGGASTYTLPAGARNVGTYGGATFCRIPIARQ